LRLGLLFAALYVLSRFGLGLVPITLIALAACYVAQLPTNVSNSYVLTYYAWLPVLLLFSSAAVALLIPAATRFRSPVLLILSTLFGVTAAFILNYRTAYGAAMILQGVAALFVYYLLNRTRMSGRSWVLRSVAILSGITIGFILFQGLFIRSLERGLQYNYSYHSIWHPVLLGLSIPDNPLAKSEGIKWDDAVGFAIAKKADPNVDYIGPTYDAVLRKVYMDLWRNRPAEMFNLYLNKVYELSRTMPLVSSIVPNGNVWFVFLLVALICGLLFMQVSPALMCYTVALAVGLGLISIEQTVVMPLFYVQYQGSLVSGFFALLVLVGAFPIVWLLRSVAAGARTDTENRLPWPLLTWVTLPFALALTAQLPLPPEVIPIGPITALGENAWTEVMPPTRLAGRELRLEGASPTRSAYAAVSAPYQLLAGARVAVAGEAREGGLRLGLLDAQNEWAATSSVLSGHFRRSIMAPEEGEYRIVLTYDRSPWRTANDVRVTEIGLVRLDPVALRVEPPGVESKPSPEVTPLGQDAWQYVLPPAQTLKGEVRLAGKPETPFAYGTLSTPLRLPAGARVAVAGEVREGGIRLGLLDTQGQFAAAAVAPPGHFRRVVEAPRNGEYRIVLAYNLAPWQTANDAHVTEVGLVGLDPASLQVEPPAAPKDKTRRSRPWYQAVALWPHRIWRLLGDQFGWGSTSAPKLEAGAQ